MPSSDLSNFIYSGLYGITDPQLMLDDSLLLKKVELALQGGMSLLQYRNKGVLSSSDARRQAKLLVALCHNYGIPLIVNDDVSLAADIGADGVHLGQQDISLCEAKKLLSQQAIIGVTCHNSLSLAYQAEKEGASYVAFGQFFSSKTKPLAQQATISTLTEVKKHCSLPVVAIGGITLDNCKIVIDAGANMIAVIHALFAEPNVAENAQAFARHFYN